MAETLLDHQPALLDRSVPPLAQQRPYVALACALVFTGLYLVFLILGRPVLFYLNLTATAALGLVALASWRRWLPVIGSIGRTWSMVLLISIALLLAMMVWNIAFTAYYTSTGYERDIFREVFQTYHAPVYGYRQLHRDVAKLGQSLIAVLAAAVAAMWLWKRWDALLMGRSVRWELAVVLLLLIAGMALSDGPTRLFTNVAGYADFEIELKWFASPMALLREFTQTMDRMGLRPAHYPPGSLLLLQIGHQMDFVGFAKLVVVASVVLTLIPLAGIARELNWTASANGLSQILYVTSAGVMIFTTTDITCIVMFLTAMTVWLYLRGIKRGGWGDAIAMGLVFAVYTMFSFSSPMVAMVMGLLGALALQHHTANLTNTCKTILVSSAVFFAFFIGLWLASGFNAYDCFRHAVENNQKIMSDGFDDWIRYAIRSPGALLAYLCLAGFPMAALGILGVTVPRNNDGQRWERTFIWAVTWSMAIAAWSSLFFLETERVWLFFTPVLALVAGWELDRRQTDEGPLMSKGLVLFSLILASSQEVFFSHYFF